MTTAKTTKRIFVLGATGGIGREAVDQALKRGHRVTAFVRNPQKVGGPRKDLTVIQGDILNAERLSSALAGHDVVLSAIGPPGPGPSTITSDSARATVAAMRSAGVDRLMIVGVAMLFEDSGFLGRVLRNIFLRNIARDSADMEKVVKASVLEWTIVRPPRLTNRPGSGLYAVADDRLPPSAGGAAVISRADVAHFLLNEVELPAHVRRVVGIAYRKNANG